MDLVHCPTCTTDWDASAVPVCPRCLARRWLETPNLIREKHDPEARADPHATYRSVVTPWLVTHLAAVLEFAAAHGSWFYDTGYQMLVHLTERPLGRAPGVGILAGRPEPDHALDCLLIAEAGSRESAHVFAVDGERHAAQVRAGLFRPLRECVIAACAHLAVPSGECCVTHRLVEKSGNRPGLSGDLPIGSF